MPVCDSCYRKWPENEHVHDWTALMSFLLQCPVKMLVVGGRTTSNSCMNYMFINCLQFLCFRKICVPWQSNIPYTLYLIMSFLESLFLLELIFSCFWLDMINSQKTRTGNRPIHSAASCPYMSPFTFLSSVCFSLRGAITPASSSRHLD